MWTNECILYEMENENRVRDRHVDREARGAEQENVCETKITHMDYLDK